MNNHTFYLWLDNMQKYEKVNINLKDFEKDYWEWALRDYIRTHDNTKHKYIINPYKTFMKTIIWLSDYKNILAKNLWKYWTYLLSIPDYSRDDNSIDVNLFKEKILFSDSSFIRLIRVYKEHWVLKKVWHTFYLNPLIVHYGKEIDLELGILFKEELEKVWITIK